ncbi:MAG: SWIM zinc finger family protein [Pseudomonadota bacterium]
MAFTLEKIERLAPDQASLTAAKKLLKPAKWPLLEHNSEGLIWGECQGSGSTPYRVVVSELDTGYKCTCPSRKFPCKHALALMWIRAEEIAPFSEGTPPQWVSDWLSRRRGTTAAPVAKKKDGEGKKGPKPSIAATKLESEPKELSPEALAKAEAARERNRKKREELIIGGIAAMDQWIEDQLQRGLSGFDQRAMQDCDTLAKRLVDAKAGGLANRISSLPTHLFEVQEQHRPLVAARALSRAYLIGQAYTRQDTLPEALREDVRQAIGWTLTREDLLSNPSTERVSGHWRVMVTRDEVQPDKLRRIETWLEKTDEDRRKAVLLDFIPVSGGASGTMFDTGEVLDAELAFYPSPVPLRAQIAEHRGTQPPEAEWDGVSGTLKDQHFTWQAALAQKPWLDAFPISATGVKVRSSGRRLFACADGASLPIAPSYLEQARPLTEAGEVSLFGVWDGHDLKPLVAATSLGEWVAA